MIHVFGHRSHTCFFLRNFLPILEPFLPKDQLSQLNFM